MLYTALIAFAFAMLCHYYFVLKDAKLPRDQLSALLLATLNARMPQGLQSKIDSKAPLKGFNVIVTGASAGLGKAIASELYSFGASITMSGRSEGRLKDAIKDLKLLHPNSSGQLEVGIVDTSDLQSVAEFSKWYQRTHTSLNFLVNNAGIHYVSYDGGQALWNASLIPTSKQGYDLAFATNYLGHFALTNSLLPLLQVTASTMGLARVLNVASTFHFQSDGSMLEPKRDSNNAPSSTKSSVMPKAARAEADLYQRSISYPNNKLAQILHAKELQKRLDATNKDKDKDNNNNKVEIVSTCPLFTSTEMFPDNLPGWIGHFFAFSSSAGTLGPLAALFSDSVHGGEWITNGYISIVSQSWSPSLLQWFTKHGLRDVLMLLMSGPVLIMQRLSYGAYAHVSSPESYNATLAKSLFDWSEQVTGPFIYA